MTESQMIKTVNYLLFFAYAFLFYGLTYYVTEEHREYAKDKVVKYEQMQAKPTKEEKRRVFPVISFSAQDLKKVIIPGREMQTEYLGHYFITAYTAEECGWNYGTSSGATCHYEEEWYEPTTCAIDRSVHGYGELLLVGDPESTDRKVYVTEDTGSGVKGLWVDCYVDSMAEVRTWQTGWRPVYSVSFETKNIVITEKEYLYGLIEHYLFMRSGCVWSDYRNDC